MASFSPRYAVTVCKAAIVLIWLVLFALLLRRDVYIKTIDSRETSLLEQVSREDYQGVYFKDKKIGYVANIFHSSDDRSLTVEQQARMTLNVAGTSNTIHLDLKARLRPDGSLKDFTFSFRSPLYRMQADGQAHGNKVTFNLLTGSATIHDSLELSAPPMLSTSRRAYLVKGEVKEGQKFKIPSFDPVTLTAQESVVEYRGKERIFIHGRIQNLHHFVEMFSGVRVNSWLDDSGDVIKEESPAGFVFLREPKFKAMGGSGESPELLSAASVGLIGTMPPFETRQQMHYRLKFPDDGAFQLNSGRQKYVGDILSITLESLPGSATNILAPCTAGASDLAATPYVQSNHPKIRKLASEIIGGRQDSLDQVRALAEYVSTHLEKRPVLGFPDALTVLDSGKGDCNEHAVLFAALARAAGIPCRLVAGVVFFKEAFYYHAWNEVCVHGQWLSLDTTTNQLPADLSHIKFVEGEIKQQMRIGALIGQLSIEPLQNPVNPQTPEKISRPKEESSP